MNASDIIWTIAGEREEVPGTLADLPAPALLRVNAWLGRGLTTCGHETDLHFALFPERFATCWPCSVRAGIWRQASRCGACGAPVGSDGLAAVEALGDDVLAIISLCLECSEGSIMTRSAARLGRARRNINLRRTLRDSPELSMVREAVVRAMLAEGFSDSRLRARAVDRAVEVAVEVQMDAAQGATR